MTTTPDRDLTVDEKLALDAAGLDMDLDLMRTAGLALGGMMGRARTARAVLLQAVKDAFDGEAAYAAGLFREVRDEEFHTDRPNIVVLCGSTRFRDEFQAENRRLTLAGCIVLAPGVFGHAGDPAPTEAEKAALDELHFRKIDLADRVVVINPGGYVGDSTRREIDYAISCGKVISWLEGREDTREEIADRLRPFVACKAPDQWHPTWFCKLPLGHNEGCDYVPVDQLPDSADDEGGDKCGAVSPFGGTACIKAAGHLEAGDPVHDDGDEPTTDPAQARLDEQRDDAFRTDMRLAQAGIPYRLSQPPARRAWCGDPDHDDPCSNCETALLDASDALRQRMPGHYRGGTAA